MSFEVDEAQVADFGGYLGAEASQTLPTIEQLARDEGMSAHGFLGLLSPLGDIVKGEASELVGTAFSEMQTKMCQLGDAVIGAAKSYGYMDEDGRSMMERVNLEDNPGNDVTYGNFPYRYHHDVTDEDFEDPGHRDYSDFRTTDLTVPSIDRGDTDYSEDLEKGVGPVLNVLDWIWSEFEVDGGKGFTDSIISPLAGNYNSISANGEAWKGVGTQFGELVGNMGTNATTLAANHWEGDAADAFKQFIDVFWTKGAAWAGQKVGEFIAKGFDKVAEVSKKLAELAVKLVNEIIEKAVKIAAKFIPYVGWAWAAIEYIAKFIGLDVDALHNDIMNIIELAKQVWKLHGHITNVVDTMQGYFTTAQELGDTVAKIPEIGSLQDAVDTYDTINEQSAALEEQKNTIEEEATKADETLEEIDRIAEEATQ